MKKELTIQGKRAIIEEGEEKGLVITLPKYGITYATFVTWKEEIVRLESERTTNERITVTHRSASSILTPATGFMNGYDYTLNPYSGCAFGCTYCYAAFFTKRKELQASWGNWVEVKENALELLLKLRKKNLTGKTIYMSSVTDPYQPIERQLKLTRSLLVELATYHQPHLVIQTRSPIVTRDIDILKQFKRVQVNMTITTDSEKVRKVFEPFCSSNEVRFKAIKEIHEAGISSCITVTPMLPIEDPGQFISRLVNTGVKNYIVQPFHGDGGRYVGGTRERAQALLREMNWTTDRYNEVQSMMRDKIPGIGIGKNGFNPI
jgi:DNA repair photolyase